MTRSTTPSRLRAGDRGEEAASPAKRRIVVVTAALAVAVAMLLAGIWGLQADRSGGDQAGTAPVGWVDVPGGRLTVREVSDRAVNHKGMPNMQTMPDPDPVPKGYVRLTVDLSLAARDDTLRWKPADFTVEGDGVGVVRPHRSQLGDGVVPEGSQVAGGLTFEVPKKARSLTLRFRGGGSVPLELPASHHGTTAPSSAESPNDHGDDNEQGARDGH
jgi:hypothetical protein